MKMKTIIASVALASFLFTSCKKDAASPENTTTSSFTYRLQAVNPSSAIGRANVTSRTEGVNLQWTSGTASATLLKFEAKGSNGEVEFKQKTAQQIDLFSASSALGNVSIPAGTYSEVEFKAALAPVGSSPALQLNGNFTSGSVTRQVQFVVNSNLELKAEKKNITVAQGTVYSALNNIDLSQLTKGVSETALSNATLSNGIIVISATSNADLYNTIVNNLRSHHGEAEVEHENEHEHEHEHEHGG